MLIPRAVNCWQVADLKKLIDELRNDVDKVKVLHSDILSAFHTDKKKESKWKYNFVYIKKFNIYV